MQKWDCSTIYVELLHKKLQNLSFWIFQERNIWGFRGKNTTALEIRRADALHHYNVRHQGALISKFKIKRQKATLVALSNQSVDFKTIIKGLLKCFLQKSNPIHHDIFSNWFIMWELIINSIWIINKKNSLFILMSCFLGLMVD